MKSYKIAAFVICVSAFIGMAISVHAAPTYIDPGWRSGPTLNLDVPTRSIEFDSSNNLYIETIGNDGEGQVRVAVLDAASAYTSISLFEAYDTTYQGVTGLVFGGSGSLYVNERSADNDSGIIRSIDGDSGTDPVDVIALPDHRPTGISADADGNIYYTGRLISEPTFGNVYQVDTFGTQSIFMDGVVGTGIALDDTGNIFISTPIRTDLALGANSIYMFDPNDLSNPLLIAEFDGDTVDELAFDEDGNLYAVDNADHRIIYQFTRVPVPAAVWLLGSGLIGLLGLARRNRRG